MNKDEKMKLIDFPPDSQAEIYLPAIHWIQYKKEMQIFIDYVHGDLKPENVNKIKALVCDIVGAMHLEAGIEEKIKNVPK